MKDFSTLWEVIQKKAASVSSRQWMYAALGLLLTYIILQISWLAWKSTLPDDARALVPTSALCFAKIENAPALAERVRKSPLWEQAWQAQALAAWRETTRVLWPPDSLLSSVPKATEKIAVGVSLHATAAHEIDALLYLPLPLRASEILLRNAKDSLREEKRNYQDYELLNFYQKKGSKELLFSCVWLEGYWVVSPTPVLVEEVVRHVSQGGEAPAYFAQQKSWKPFAAFEKFRVEVWTDFEKVGAFLNNFQKDNAENNFPTWGEALGLELFFTEEDVVLQGRAYSAASEAYLKAWEGQGVAKIEQLLEFIPLETAILRISHVKEGTSLHDNLQDYWETHALPQAEAHERLIEEGLSVAQIYNHLEGAFFRVTLEPQTEEENEQLLLLHVADTTRVLELLDAARAPEAEKFTQTYGHRSIRRLGLEEVPARLLGEEYAGYSDTWYVPLRDGWLVFGNSAEVLERYLQNIENQDVWAKLVRQRQFIAQLNAKSTHTYIVNIPRAWPLFLPELAEGWEAWVKNEKFGLLHAGFLGLQVGAIKNEKADARLALRLSPKAPPPLEATANPQESFSLEWRKNVKGRARGGPHVVRNYRNRSFEMLVEDEQNTLHLFNKDGKKLWAFSLPEPLASDVRSIDFYKNGQIQYLFATKSRLYILDRMGRPTAKFNGMKLPPLTEVQWLSVFDYDKNGNYRFLVSDTEGNQHMYSKWQKALTGWKPRKLGGPLASPLQHLRVGKRDAFLGVEADGTLSLIRRNSTLYSGFPILLRKKVLSAPLIRRGKDFAHTQVSVLAADGELIRFDLNGKIRLRRELNPDLPDGDFKMITDRVSRRDWLAACQQNHRILIYAPDGKLWFEKYFKNATEKIVQYYNFGGNVSLIAITDTREAETYLYRPDGKLIGSKPIPSRGEIGVVFEEKDRHFRLFATYANQARVYRFPVE